MRPDCEHGLGPQSLTLVGELTSIPVGGPPRRDLRPFYVVRCKEALTFWWRTRFYPCKQSRLHPTQTETP